jgi:hypothetical protein
VLSPDPRLLRLGQLLAKPRGVVPKENNLRLKLNLSTIKMNLGVLLQQEQNNNKTNAKNHKIYVNVAEMKIVV